MNDPKRKKILILADWYEPGFHAGGPIQSVTNFVARMHGLYDLRVVTGDRDLGATTGYPDISKDQWVTRAPGLPVFYASRLGRARLGQILVEFRPDFLYLNSVYSLRFAILPLYLLWRRKIGAKVILAPRGMLADSAVRHKSGKKKPYLDLLRRLHIPEKIVFHVTDAQEKKAVLEHFPRAGDIQVIPNFSPPLEAPIEPIEKIPGRLRCIFIGRIMDIKNLAFFTRLLPSLPGGIDLELSLYGSIENQLYWEGIQQQIAACPPAIRVSYQGAIPHGRVREVLDRHHLFVLPTRGENFGHAIFEAFAAGRPVLISDQTPWRDLDEKGAGWDLSLEAPTAWLRAVETAAGWDQADFDRQSKAAFTVARSYQEKTDLPAAYQNLFH